MALTVEQLQNSVPTDWTKFDQELQERSSGDANRFKDDHKLHVRFFTAPVLDLEASHEAGRAVYRQAEMVEIMMPGDKNNIIRDLVWDQHRQRFAAKYEAFKKGLSQDIGSPLTALPFLSESKIKELEYFKIRTVEQLADLSDNVKQKFMGSDALSRQAREWLDRFNSPDVLRKEMDTKLTEAHAQNVALAEQLAAMQAQLAALQAAQAKQAERGKYDQNVKR